jgi:hypothetical protein
MGRIQELAVGIDEEDPSIDLDTFALENSPQVFYRVVPFPGSLATVPPDLK